MNVDRIQPVLAELSGAKTKADAEVRANDVELPVRVNVALRATLLNLIRQASGDGVVTDYFQGVVAEYLRADRGVFVNPEILLQLEPGASPKKGQFWYCDLMAVSLRERVVYLCEVTYSSSASALIKRLEAWKTHWPELKFALQRDCGVDASWQVLPWVFLPESRRPVYERKLATLGEFGEPGMPTPRFTALEDVVPWKYCTWDRQPDA